MHPDTIVHQDKLQQKHTPAITTLTFLSRGIKTALNLAPTARTSRIIVSITGSSKVLTGANNSSTPLAPPPPLIAECGGGEVDDDEP